MPFARSTSFRSASFRRRRSRSRIAPRRRPGVCATTAASFANPASVDLPSENRPSNSSPARSGITSRCRMRYGKASGNLFEIGLSSRLTDGGRVQRLEPMTGFRAEGKSRIEHQGRNREARVHSIELKRLRTKAVNNRCLGPDS